MPRSNGRPKGSKNKATLLREKANVEMLETATAEGISPLDLMLRSMRDAWSEHLRLRALAQERALTKDENNALWQALAQAVRIAAYTAPYVHGKMTPVESKIQQPLVINLKQY